MYLTAISGVYVETLGIIDLALRASLNQAEIPKEPLENFHKYKIWGHYKRCSSRYNDSTVAESKLVYDFNEFIDCVKEKVKTIENIMREDKKLKLSKNVFMRKEQKGAILFVKEYETAYYIDEELYRILTSTSNSPKRASELTSCVGKELLVKMILAGILVPIEEK